MALTYLNFKGNNTKASGFYKSVYGVDFLSTHRCRFGAQGTQLPDFEKKKNYTWIFSAPMKPGERVTITQTSLFCHLRLQSYLIFYPLNNFRAGNIFTMPVARSYITSYHTQTYFYMRLLNGFLILLLSLSSFQAKTISISLNKINGTWLPVKQELGGKVIPKAIYEKQKLIIDDSTYTVIAESVDKGTIKYKDNKIDIYGKEGVNAGKHFTAIFKYENEELTICYNLAGDSYPELYETKNKPLFFLSVFKKETVK